MRLLRYPKDDDASSIFETEDLSIPRGLVTALLFRDLHEMKRLFETTENPLYALNALVVCTEQRIYPPIWALKFIADRVGVWQDKEQSLDRAFGLTSEGKGKRTPPREQADLRHRNQLLMSFVHKLEAVGLSRGEATKALASLLDSLPADGGLQIEGCIHLSLARRKVDGVLTLELSEKQIVKIVSEMEVEFPKAKSTTEEQAEAWTKDDKRRLLEQFLPAELPKEIVKEFGCRVPASHVRAGKPKG